MYWQDDERDEVATPSDTILDLLFSVQCRALPVDHAHALGQALLAVVPWLGAEPGCAVHSIHVAGSQNGWERPRAGGDQPLMLSRRTKLGIRVPKARAAALEAALRDRVLDIHGYPLRIGDAKPRPLHPDSTLLARHVAAQGLDQEHDFLAWVAAELNRRAIRVRKALCGKSVGLATPEGFLVTRSLLLANLAADESLRLQQEGIGTHSHMGCGIFIPHKGIEPVGKTRD